MPIYCVPLYMVFAVCFLWYGHGDLIVSSGSGRFLSSLRFEPPAQKKQNTRLNKKQTSGPKNKIILPPGCAVIVRVPEMIRIIKTPGFIRGIVISVSFPAPQPGLTGSIFPARPASGRCCRSENRCSESSSSLRHHFGITSALTPAFSEKSRHFP